MHQELQAKLAMTLPALFQHGDAAKLSLIVGMITLDRSEGEFLLVMVICVPVHGCLSHTHVQMPCILTALLLHSACVVQHCSHNSDIRHCRCLHRPLLVTAVAYIGKVQCVAHTLHKQIGVLAATDEATQQSVDEASSQSVEGASPQSVRARQVNKKRHRCDQFAACK